LHFKYACYRKSYIKDCFASEEDFLEQLKVRQSAVEALIPSNLLQKDRQEVLRTLNLAVCRINLDVTTSVVQVGDYITATQKMHIIVSGTKDGKHISVAVSVDVNGLITCEQIESLDDVKVDKAVAHDGKVLIQSGAKLCLYNF